MIISLTGAMVIVESAVLKRPDGTKIRLFGSSVELENFLKKHPDQDFLLEPIRYGDIVPPELRGGHGVAMGDIACGQVKYDSGVGVVVCS